MNLQDVLCQEEDILMAYIKRLKQKENVKVKKRK